MNVESGFILCFILCFCMRVDWSVELQHTLICLLSFRLYLMTKCVCCPFGCIWSSDLIKWCMLHVACCIWSSDLIKWCMLHVVSDHQIWSNDACCMLLHSHLMHTLTVINARMHLFLTHTLTVTNAFLHSPLTYTLTVVKISDKYSHSS